MENLFLVFHLNILVLKEFLLQILIDKLHSLINISIFGKVCSLFLFPSISNNLN